MPKVVLPVTKVEVEVELGTKEFGFAVIKLGARGDGFDDEESGESDTITPSEELEETEE